MPKPKKNQTTSSIKKPTTFREIPAAGDSGAVSPGSVDSEIKTGLPGGGDLAAIEASLTAGKTPGEAGKEAAAPGGQEAPKKKRFKRPPPENTIKILWRQWWRFRAWMVKKQLGLPEELFPAILEGMDEKLVDPLVGPTIAVMDEYMPEEWVRFIEEKSPLLTMIFVVFEAEQSFANRAAEIKKDLPNYRPQTPQVNNNGNAAPAGGSGYPKIGEVVSR